MSLVMENVQRKHLFKVWNWTRDKKIMVLVQEPNVLDKVIARASEKLQIKGTQLVLHTDGTQVDEDDILIMLKSETWILLAEHEKWIPENYNYAINSPLSMQSPKTLHSSDDTSQISNENEELTSKSNAEITLKPIGELTSKPNVSTENITLKSSNVTSNLKTNIDITSTPRPIFDVTSKSADITSNSADITSNFAKNPSNCCNNSVCGCTLGQIWAEYSIPWLKMPQSLTNSCLEGARDKLTVTAMCHFVIDEMMAVDNGWIPQEALRRVSLEIVRRFPRSFCDKDDQGIEIADGHSTLLRKLKERHSYLRRIGKKHGFRSPGRRAGCFSEVSLARDSPDFVDTEKLLLEEVNPLETSCKSEDLSDQSTETSFSTIMIKEDPIGVNFSEENSVLMNFFTDSLSNADVSWCNWSIPWHKMPTSLLQSCQEGCREKQTINKICRFIIDEMLAFNGHITAKALRAVARQFLNKYPRSFCKTDGEGLVTDDGFKLLFLRLNERACYLRRPGKRKDDVGLVVRRRRKSAKN